MWWRRREQRPTASARRQYSGSHRRNHRSEQFLQPRGEDNCARSHCRVGVEQLRGRVRGRDVCGAQRDLRRWGDFLASGARLLQPHLRYGWNVRLPLHVARRRNVGENNRPVASRSARLYGEDALDVLPIGAKLSALHICAPAEQRDHYFRRSGGNGFAVVARFERNVSATDQQIR